MITNKELTDRQITFVEVIIIILFAVYKLFASYVLYDINVFVEWEGAYRLSTGQLPYRDFGMPVGYVFWVIPAIFFKILGPHVFTLIIAQVFINLVSNVAFWRILKTLGMSPAIRLAAVLIYCISYSFENHWPWYNHSVFVFELIGLYFIICSVVNDRINKKSYIYIVLGGFFMALSLLTKQDSGGLGLVFSLIMISYSSWVHQSFQPLIIFLAGYVFFLSVLIVPFLPYDFLYWFNYGQAPHFSRISWFDFIDAFLQNSALIKLYLLFVGMIWISKLHTTSFKALLHNKREIVFILLTAGILVQAAMVQVTSYTPSDGNIYFHSFAFAYIFSNINLNIKYEKSYMAAALFVFAGLWWSGKPWKLVRNQVEKLQAFNAVDTVVSRRTFIVDTVGFQYDPKWEPSELKVFRRIKMPEATNEGIDKLLNMPLVKNNEGLKVLNMSELTPLAYEIGYRMETGPDYPLWFHKGVAFFDAEVDRFCKKIDTQAYDLILFEDIPQLNQFYPYEVRDCIRENYKMEYKFLAPRRKPFFGWIEVYVKY